MNKMDLKNTLSKIKKLSRHLAVLEDTHIREVLYAIADGLEKEMGKILTANAEDLKKIDESDVIYDRVLLNEERVKAIAHSVRDIAGYDSPIGVVLEQRRLDCGLELSKVSTPIGVVGAIFEARPNVVVDIFTLCFKSKNCCVLKGGSDSAASNEALMAVIRGALGDLAGVVELLPNNRELVAEFLQADKYVDVIIPRGSQSLIDFTRKTASVPVIETGAGVVHTYVDESAALEMAKRIIFNAKTSRPSVCNALDTLIIHRSRLSDLSSICDDLANADVEIYADEESYAALEGKYEKLFKVNDFGVEYLRLKMSIKTVDNLDEAVDHINNYGSGHSEAIITGDKNAAEKFMAAVDAACIYQNASTRFTDGGVFGLGAEVGISTQKLHARGPMGIKELCSYKWKLVGEGQVR